MLEPTGFRVLLEDGPLLVIAKPAGLLTQAPPGIDSLEWRVKRWLIERENKPGKAYLGVPHRLDRPVSGVILFAKHVRAARRLSEQFEGRLIRKTYWALVEGKVAESTTGERQTWREYLKKLDAEPRSLVCESHEPGAKLAIMHTQVRGSGPTGEPPSPATWLEIELETGRNHQIRVQSAHRGHPLWGDELYGSTHTFGPPSHDPRERLIALHARSIEFDHPMTKERLTVEAPVTEYWPDWVTNT